MAPACLLRERVCHAALCMAYLLCIARLYVLLPIKQQFLDNLLANLTTRLVGCVWASNCIVIVVVVVVVIMDSGFLLVSGRSDSASDSASPCGRLAYSASVWSSNCVWHLTLNVTAIFFLPRINYSLFYKSFRTIIP